MFFWSKVLRKRAKEGKTRGLCSIWGCHGVRAGVGQSSEVWGAGGSEVGGGEQSTEVHRSGGAAGLEALGTCLKRRCLQALSWALCEPQSPLPAPGTWTFKGKKGVLIGY